MSKQSMPGRIEIRQDGSVWWVRIDSKVECLSDADSLCGIAKLWSTGADDPFRDCCSWHDKAYDPTGYFRTHLQWSRSQIDEYFLHLMMGIAEDNASLITRAYSYYLAVRACGWMFFNRTEARKIRARMNWIQTGLERRAMADVPEPPAYPGVSPSEIDF